MAVPTLEVKSLDAPDERTSFTDASVRSLVDVGGVRIGRGVYEPGWRWSEHARPLVGRDSAVHIGYVVSGHMVVRARDGREVTVGPGDAFFVGPSTMHGSSVTRHASLSTLARHSLLVE